MHALDRDLAAKVSYITTLESQVQTHEKEIKKLKDINTLISQEKVTLAKLNQDFANKVEDMTKKIDHLDQEIEKHLNTIASMTAKKSDVDLSLSKNKN
jgi:hypothetical protein